MAQTITAKPVSTASGLGFFERYLSLWVALCMVAGIGLGKLLPGAIASLRGIEFGHGSQINAPIAVLIWLMITPMMMKVDFSSVKNVGRRPAGLLVTLFINWVVKPFSMALLAWAFFRIIFAAFITTAEADQYIAGCIILAAAPCTAMVFVWSHLTKGDAGLYARAGIGERSDHAGAVRANRAVFGAWRIVADGAFQRAADLRAGVYRRAAAGRGAAAVRAGQEVAGGHGLKACCCRNSRRSRSRRCSVRWC